MAVVDFANLRPKQAQLAAVAEVTSKTGTTHEWATQFRRNILGSTVSLAATFSCC